MTTRKDKKESLKEKRRRLATKHQKALEAERLKREKRRKKSKGWPKGKILGVASIFLLIIGVYSAWQHTQSVSTNNSTGDKEKAPLFALTDIDGNTVSLEGFIGKVVVLDFFYIRCSYCDDELLELERIQKTYGSDDVVIISISIDPNFDTVDRLREFKTGPNQYSQLNYEISWVLTRDTSGVSEKYSITAAPTVVIVDKEGFISPHSAYVGLTDFSTLSNEIDMLLNQ
ncbi:TlpA family protein disulfide reductase [Candidatus Bathyarchaeota archaeon]|nr:MAG: TlpA family protein disulfide reductase [Candidatus Bathyarchaeota archaeon]